MRTVLLVDDHAEARGRMRRLIGEVLDSEHIVESATFDDATAKLRSHTFDLAVLDLALPDGSGEDLIQPILDKNPNCYVIISTIHDESKRLITALSRGAKGYLLKEQPEETLKQAIAGIQSGVPPLSASVTRRILEHLRLYPDAQTNNHAGELPQERDVGTKQPGSVNLDVKGVEDLTPREAEILVLLARGFNRPDIAGILNISKHTVATHVSNIYGKLGISSRSEAANAARDLGLN